MLRAVIALAASLLLSGCCSYWRTDACVVNDECTSTGTEIPLCEERPRQYPLCPGVLHEGDHCDDIGFTRYCGEDRWVRPWASC